MNKLFLWLAVCLALGGQAAAQAQAPCRQALALGLDVSGSVDSREYRLQLDGLAGALTSDEVRRALLAMPVAPVELLVFEWSGPDHQGLVAPWSRIETDADIDILAARLRTHQRRPRDPSTAIGSALLAGAGFLGQRGGCWKRTLDISGDGKSNTGPQPGDISASAAVAPYTVNGLVIGADAPAQGDRRMVEVGELVAYYEAYVISGPDSFVETALGFDDYEAAMQRKLLRELEGLAVARAGD